MVGDISGHYGRGMCVRTPPPPPLYCTLILCKKKNWRIREGSSIGQKDAGEIGWREVGQVFFLVKAHVPLLCGWKHFPAHTSGIKPGPQGLARRVLGKIGDFAQKNRLSAYIGGLTRRNWLGWRQRKEAPKGLQSSADPGIHCEPGRKGVTARREHPA
jgi:hypothetical protein